MFIHWGYWHVYEFAGFPRLSPGWLCLLRSFRLSTHFSYQNWTQMNLPFRSNLFRTRIASVVPGTCNLPNLCTKSMLRYMEVIFITNVNHLGRYCLSPESTLYIFFLFCINRNLTDLNCRSFNLYLMSAENWLFPLRLFRGFIWNNDSSHSIKSAVFKLYFCIHYWSVSMGLTSSCQMI